ncbi:MAG: hypothetical protein FWG44_05775 [Oscillospiraceae bacterium]|nr:hypothetical protein [Oscillospiraceae bacterium]
MYRLDFSKEFDDEFHWNSQKKENINEMFNILQAVYTVDYRAETALVAKNKGESSNLIYDLESCFIIRNRSENFDPIQTGSAIDFFDRGDSKVVLVHNHPEGANFSFFDIITFIHCDCVCEMFIDSDKIWYLRKYNDAYINFIDKDKAVDDLNKVFKNISKNYLKDFESIDDLDISPEEREEKRSKIYLKIRSEAFSEAVKNNIIKARLSSINKV